MKILQINKYHYVRGGSDSVYFNSSELLSKHKHEVINFAMKFDENFKSEEEQYFTKNEDFNDKSIVQKLVSLPKFFYNKEAERDLDTLIRFHKPDIAHLHIFYGSLTSSILVALKKNKIPTVVSVHDYKFVCPAYLFLDGTNSICERCEGHKYYQAVVNRCVKGSRFFSSVFALESYFRDKFYPLHKMFDKLIFVSRFAANIHVKYKPELKSITSHLYNFDPTLSNTIFNCHQGNYLVYAGRLSKEKGLNTLVKAATSVPHTKLIVVGSGPELNQLQAEAGDNVEFVGFKSGAELKSIIANSSFVIVPSEWYENNPMAIIEAYSLSKPVIAAEIGGIPEIVNNDLTGYLFPPGDLSTLTAILSKVHNLDPESYRSLARNAYNFSVANFHPDFHYNELMNIYKDAIAYNKVNNVD